MQTRAVQLATGRLINLSPNTTKRSYRLFTGIAKSPNRGFECS